MPHAHRRRKGGESRGNCYVVRFVRLLERSNQQPPTQQPNNLPSGYEEKFHRAMVATSPKLLPSLRTTEASKPLCIMQF